MFKRVIVILIFLFPLFQFSQDFSALWKGHFSYNEIKDVTQGNNIIYAAADNAIFSLDTQTNEMKEITTVNGLSGESISTIYYSIDYELLVIGYENGLIEIVFDNDTEILSVVDIIDKPRSTGSILKPFLYAAMLDAGDILPNTLVADVPTQFGSYNPENYNKTYDGVVSASRALSRSLNVPSVRMLQGFGLDRFHHYLKQLKLKDLKYNANHYGLSLILGGAESNLWDLCKSYAALSSTLNHFSETSSEYFSNEFCEPTFLASKNIDFGKKTSDKTLFDAASIYLTYESLKEVNRPESDESWEFFDGSKQIAWKTGTSFGFRDAWAIGSTKDYVVGVWVGNADGEGRPGLVGVQTAAPILFDVFDLLPNSDWFSKPFDDMQEISICKKSGYRASQNCDDVETKFIQKSGLKTKPCPYHILVHLDKTETFQVNSSCEDINNIKHKSWFVLPPLMAYYYKTKNPFYKPLPKFRSDCLGENGVSIEFIYPKENTTVFLPKDFDGNVNEVVLKIAHSKPEATLFWYVDAEFVGTTTDIHDFAMMPKVGKHSNSLLGMEQVKNRTIILIRIINRMKELITID